MNVRGVFPNTPNCLNRRQSAHSMPKLLLQKLLPITFLKSFVLNSCWKKSLDLSILHSVWFVYATHSKKDKHIYLTGFTAQNSKNTFCCLFEFCFLFSLKDTIHGYLPMKFFLANCLCCSIKTHAISTFLACMYAFMASAVLLQGM
jgi:hypothetical protein